MESSIAYNGMSSVALTVWIVTLPKAVIVQALEYVRHT